MSMRAIYETSGKAREYCELACNLYTGCSHGCLYCYNRFMQGKWGIPDFDKPKPREGILEALEAGASKRHRNGDHRPVFLCFTCDPYQPLDTGVQFTRTAIEILHSYKLPVMILTKGGLLAERDFDLLGGEDWFGVTLTLANTSDSVTWEPHAAVPFERILSLYDAQKQGIKTWVSLEPIIDPEQTISLIKESAAFTNHYKVGKLNHIKPNSTVGDKVFIGSIDWGKVIPKIKQTLDNYGCDYYIKKDTAKYLEVKA